MSEEKRQSSVPSTSRCSTAVSDLIRSVAGAVPNVIDEDPRKIVGAILLLIDEICIDGELEETFDKWRDRVAESWCELSGEHWRCEMVLCSVDSVKLLALGDIQNKAREALR